MTGDLADLAETAAAQAATVLRNGRRAVRRALSERPPTLATVQRGLPIGVTTPSPASRAVS
jgi:hypothetical protein